MSLVYYDPLFNRSTGSRDIDLTTINSETAIINTGTINTLSGSNLIYLNAFLNRIDNCNSLSATNGTINTLLSTNGTINTLSGTTLTYPTANITTIQSNNDMNILVSGDTKTLSIDCDGDNSTIKIGNRTTNDKSKLIYIGNYGTTELGTGTYINMACRLLQITTGDRLQIDGNYISCNDIRPNSNATKSLGTSILRWNYIYGVNLNVSNINLNGQTTFEPALTKGTLTGSTPLSVTGNGQVIGTNTTISMAQSGANSNGWLSSIDWNTFNNKSGGVITGTLTSSNPLSITGGGKVIDADTIISMAQSGINSSGWLSSVDWNTFNNKQTALSNASATVSGILTNTDWNTFNNKQNTLQNASATISGILTNTDWNIFNNKQTALSNASATVSGILTNTDWNTFNNKQTALSNASATVSGILTNTDWNTFNNKSTYSLPSGITFTNNSLSSNDNFTFSTTGTAKNLNINATGTLSIENDNDASVINIGYYDGSSTTQNKTINIGDANDTTININGTYINVLNKLRVGNDSSTLTNDLSIQTTNTSSSAYIYCNKVGGGGVAYNRIGSWGGGEIYIVANATGSAYRGITNGTTGISAVYGDLTLCANATTQLEYIRLGKIGETSYIQCNQDTLPKQNNTLNLGGTNNYWSNIYGNIIHTSLINKNNGSLTLQTITAGDINISSIGNVNIGTNDNANTVNIGYNNGGTQNKTVNIGSNVNSSTTNIMSGSGGITLQTTTSDINILPAGNVNISTTDNANTVNIGYISNATQIKTVNVGSDYTYSITNIRSGGGTWGGLTFSETVASHFVPKNDGVYNLGSGTKRFENLFVKNINTTTFNITTLITTEVNSGGNLTLKSSGGSLNLLGGGGGIKVLSHILPWAVDTYNIGSASLHFDQMYANTYNTISDKRLKTNIRPLTDCMPFINKLQPVKFNYINHKKNVFGFIAQDVKRNLDDENQSLVNVPQKDDEYYSIDYLQFIPILVNAIQQQQKKIEDLERKINILSTQYI